MTALEDEPMARTPTPDPEGLSEAFANLHLSFGRATGHRTWRELRDPEVVQPWIEDHGYVSPDMDRKTRASYFINRLANTALGWVAWLDLAGYRLDSLAADELRVRPDWFRYEHEGEVGHYLSYRGNLPRLPGARQPERFGSTARGPSATAELGRQLVELWAPVIEAVYLTSKLAKAAQWRLVTDALAAAYLNIGTQVGCGDAARQRAETIARDTGKPLDNPQWHFLQVGVPAADSPSGEPLSGWFRVRGGCCRYYTTGEHEYCGTCVLLEAEERKKRFEQALRIRAQEET